MKKTCLLCNNFQINHYPWIWLITLFPTAKEYPSCVLLFLLRIIFFLQTLNRLWFFLLVSIQIALFATFLFPLNLQRAWWNVIGLKRFSLKLVSFNYLAADTTPNHDPVELESHLSEKVKHGMGAHDYFLLFAEIPERSISQIVQSMHWIGLDLLLGMVFPPH